LFEFVPEVSRNPVRFQQMMERHKDTVPVDPSGLLLRTGIAVGEIAGGLVFNVLQKYGNFFVHPTVSSAFCRREIFYL